MAKSTLFDDLMEALNDIKLHKEGKITLKTHKVEVKKLKPLSGRELIRIRRKYNVSAAVFAHFLRTNPRTLENWEQGRAKPNAQATTLIRLVDKHPETIRHLAELQDYEIRRT